MISHKFGKWARTLALVGIFMFAGAIFFQLQVAFGWNNPLANPPGGSGAIGAPSASQLTIFSATASTTANVTINGNFSPNGVISMMNSLISDVNDPIGGKDVATKRWVAAQSSSGGAAGSVVLYYRTRNGVVQGGIPLGVGPSCSALGTGWNLVMNGYGPHYIGLVAYDWLYGGTGGSGGGFGGGGGGYPPTGGGGSQEPPDPPPPPPPPGGGAGGGGMPSGYSYTVGSVAFGSDSVCSQNQQSAIPVWALYQNATTSNSTTFFADACSNNGGVIECNLCIVCSK